MAKFRGYFILLGFIVAPPNISYPTQRHYCSCHNIFAYIHTTFVRVLQSNSNFLA